MVRYRWDTDILSNTIAYSFENYVVVFYILYLYVVKNARGFIKIQRFFHFESIDKMMEEADNAGHII